jgi:hypothetical protein
MASHTRARPRTAWLGDDLREGFHTTDDQARTVHGVWLDGQRQAQDHNEAGAS